MLNYLELENWKAHGKTAINFSKGTNIFIGQMGAGKSSVLDAISFALFGTFPGIKNRRTKTNLLIRNRPDQKNTSKVKLSFTIEGIEYVVERTISIHDSAKARLEKNGSYLQSQPERVTEEITNALKIDYDVFSRAVYSEQNRLDYFLEVGASDRKKQIDNLLGIDKFATAQENSGTLLNRVKDMVGESEKIIQNFDIKTTKDSISTLSEEITNLEKHTLTLNKEVSELKNVSKEKEKELTEKKALKNKKILLEKEIAEIKSKLSVLEKELLKIKSKEMPSKEEVGLFIKTSEKLILETIKLRSSLLEKVGNFQIESGKLEKSILETQEKIKQKKINAEKLAKTPSKELTEKIELISKGLEDLEKELATLNHIKLESEKSVIELKKHIAKCPICNNELTPEKREKLLLEKTSLVSDSTVKIGSISKKRLDKKLELENLRKLQKEVYNLESRQKDFEGIEELLEKIQKEKLTCSENLKNTKKLLDECQNKATEQEKEKAKYASFKESYDRFALLEKDIEKYNLTLNEKIKINLELKIDDSQLDALQKDYTVLMSLISEKSATEVSNKKIIEDKKKQLTSKQKDLETIEKMSSDIELKKTSIDNLARFRNALQETQAVMRQRLMSSINETMQSIWPEIYPYGDYSGIEFEATESDYTLKLKTKKSDGFVWSDVNSIASGGERSIACMAMRIAFSLVLVPNLKWLILDEPTHNIDSQGLSKIVSLLNERLPSIIEQIFIITHDEKLKQVSNARIYLFSRNKAESKETVVTQL